MKEEAIWRRLTELFQDVFDDDEIEIGPDTTAEAIPEWDSLSNIQLLVAIEKAFDGVRFNTGEIVTLRNVGELVAAIQQKTAP